MQPALAPHHTPGEMGIGAFVLWAYFGKSRRETMTKADREKWTESKLIAFTWCQGDKPSASTCQPAPPQLPEQVGML